MISARWVARNFNGRTVPPELLDIQI